MEDGNPGSYGQVAAVEVGNYWSVRRRVRPLRHFRDVALCQLVAVSGYFYAVTASSQYHRSRLQR